MYRFLFFISLISGILVISRLQAQNMENYAVSKVTTKIDTNKLFSDKPVKSPTGAMLRSAILPGWGQFYNEKYVKATLALGLNGFLIQRIFYYHHRWRKTGNRDFQNKRNLFTWYWGLSYLLTLADAYVDAYLYGFNKVFELSVLAPENQYQSRFLVKCSIKF